MPDKMEVGARIKALRTNSGMTQEELANTLGISRQAVCNYETGDCIPSDRIKMKMATIFGASVQSIFFADDVNKMATNP